MKILLDHNLDRPPENASNWPRRIKEDGWADVLNGELLALLEANGFDLTLTADANIKSQQNRSNRNISIIVLRARNNRLTTHLEMLDDVQHAISKARRGDLVEVFHKDFLRSEP